MNTGDVSSWFTSGAYLADAGNAHRFGLDAAYGRQRYDGGNPLALTLAPETRDAASIGVFDRWTLSPRLSLEYGGRYSRYDYIDGGLFSPRAAVSVALAPGLRFRMAARAGDDCAGGGDVPAFHGAGAGAVAPAGTVVREPVQPRAECIRSGPGTSTWGWNAIWPAA